MEFNAIEDAIRRTHAIPDAVKRAAFLSNRMDRSMGHELRRLQRIVNPLGDALAQIEHPLGAALSRMRVVLDKLPARLPSPVRLAPIGAMLPRPVPLPALRNTDFVRIGAALAASMPKFGGYTDLFRAVTDFQEWSGTLAVAGVLESQEALLRRFGRVDLDLQSAIDAQATAIAGAGEAGTTPESLDARMDKLEAMVQQSNELLAQIARKPDRNGLYFVLGLLFTVLSIIAVEMYHADEDAARTAALQRTDANVIAMLAGQQQAQAQLEKLQQMQVQLLASVTALEPHLYTHRVIRTTTLRLMPGGRADGVVDTGQVFHVLDKQGRWVRIQFYCPERAAPRDGWILKKHAEAIPL